jgi:methionyl-tRNA formyltransferase
MLKKKTKIVFLFDKSNDYKKKYFKIFKNNNKYNFKITYNLKQIKKCDVLFIISYTKILSVSLFDKVKLPLIVHESNLPLGRGCSPVLWEVLNKKKNFYVSIIKADQKVDSGKIVLKKKFNIREDDLYEEIRHKQTISNIEIIKKFLKIYPKIKFKNQIGKPTYFRKRTIKDSELNINKSIKSQFNLMRINNNKDWPSYFYIHGKKFIIKIFKD